MTYERIVFRIHAIQRMFEHRVNETDVHRVLETGTVIEEYPEDTPYPSYLMLGFIGLRPIHVVAADNPDEGQTIVITVYDPDPDRWDSTFRRRRTP